MASCGKCSKTLPAGAMRETVKIMLPVTSRDASGQLVEATPTTVATVRGEVLGVGGGEFVRGRQIEAGTTHQVTIRYRSDVTPTHYLDWGGRRLNIDRAFDATGTKRELRIFCKEKMT